MKIKMMTLDEAFAMWETMCYSQERKNNFPFHKYIDFLKTLKWRIL